MAKEYNSFTGTMQDKPTGNILNPLTGQYREVDDNDVDLTKGDKPEWPSLTKHVNVNNDADDSEQEEAGQVEKSTDENPWPSLTGKLVSEDNQVEKISKAISMNVPVFAVEKKDDDEHIVYGIVYEPDTVDAQGDQASEEEIRKAAYHFMENNPTFKIMHKGKPVDIKVLESYIAPQDFTIEKRTIKKGSWVLVTRVNDKKLWSAIKDGTYTGYSMAGYAKVEEEN